MMSAICAMHSAGGKGHSLTGKTNENRCRSRMFLDKLSAQVGGLSAAFTAYFRTVVSVPYPYNKKRNRKMLIAAFKLCVLGVFIATSRSMKGSDIFEQLQPACINVAK